MSERLRQRDRSRLITWASNRQSADVNFHLADVVSFNGYDGWYGGPPSTINATWTKAFEWARSHWPSKPMMISETGAGGIAGW